MTRIVAAALAVFVPLAIVLGAASQGVSLRARPAIVEAFEERLALGPPEVVVLGSSLANTDVDEGLLADRLGVPRRQVVALTLPRATAPHAYAILRNRVFGGGHRPSVVLWVGALTALATPDVLGDEAAERLVRQLEGDEDVLARKTFGLGAALWLPVLRAKAEASRWRGEFVGAARHGLVGLVWAQDPAAGARLEQRARRTVLREAALVRQRAVARPTALGLDGVDALDLRGLDVARDSLVGDLVSLAVGGGAVPVFVRAPFPPTHATNDLVPAEVEAAVIDAIREGGGVYLDLRDLGLGDDAFRDMRHLTREGAGRFTEAVAEAVASVRDGRAVASAAPGRVVGVDGPPPSDPAQWAAIARALAARGLSDASPVADTPSGLAWRGPRVDRPNHPLPAWWLGAGQGLIVARGDTSEATWVVHGRRVGGGEAVRREVVVRGDPVVIPGERDAALWVEAIEDDRGRIVLGDPAARFGGAARWIGGVHVDTGWRLATPPAPPDIDVIPGVGTGASGLPALVVPGSFAFADEGADRQGHPHRCSPLRVLEDGVPLPRPSRPCGIVQREGGGASCHRRDAVLFSTTDGTDPRTNGRTYTVALDRDRVCDRRWVAGTSPERHLLWVYPGDALTLPLDSPARERLVDGADRIALTIDAVTARPGEALVWTLSVGETVVWQRWTVADGRARWTVHDALPAPLPPTPEGVVLRLRHADRDGGLFRIVRVSLGGTRPGELVEPPDPGGVIPVQWTQRGVPAALSARAVRVAPSRWRVDVPALDRWDDARVGGPWSPVRVEADGTPLARRDLTAGDGFAHRADGLLVHAAAQPRVSWAVSDGPWRAPDGAEALWILPGTARVVAFPPGTHGIWSATWRTADGRIHGAEGRAEAGPAVLASETLALVTSMAVSRGDATWTVVAPPTPRVGTAARRDSLPRPPGVP